MERPAIQRAAQSTLPTCYGNFTMIVYTTAAAKEHVALTVGRLAAAEVLLVRLHSECLTGDTFGSCRCDCGEQLQASMRAIQQEGRGILLYLRQEGRGIGLTNKIRAYALQEQGYDTVEANLALGFPPDLRTYAEAAAMLCDLGVRQVRLLTNNPAKIAGLESMGIAVVAQIPLVMPPNGYNRDYLRTKQAKLGHRLASALLYDQVEGEG